MARKPSERRHAENQIEELNLTPIMSIMVILIPMLIYMFKFDEISIQAVAAPRMGSGKSAKGQEDKKPLNLTVLISHKGFVVKQQAELQADPEPPIYKREFQGYAEPLYDYPALYNRILAKKKQYPKEDVINIGAENDIPWYIVAQTIDSVRLELVDAEYGDDYNAWAKAGAKKEETKDLDSSGRPIQRAVQLFPKVVFVVAE